jgi:hypothetical protein
MQGLEGDIDSSHVNFLHNRNWSDTTSYSRRDLAPVYEAIDTEWGVMASAKRHASPTETYHRMYQMVFPFHSFFAGPGHIWVPIDDEHTLVHSVAWDVNKPIENLDNDFLIDRELQRTSSYTGLPTVRCDDSAMTNSMGPILDRSQEPLGVGDLMIIAVRARLLKAARDLRNHGTLPPTVEHPELCRVRAGNAILPNDEDWTKANESWLLAKSNEPAPAMARFSQGSGAGPAASRRE